MSTSNEQMVRSLASSSSARQFYSFPKDTRFRQQRRPLYLPLSAINSCQNFYDLPATRMKRATSFGYGIRGLSLASRQQSPPPGAYKMPSDFEFTGKKANAYTFGISREAYAHVFAEAQPPADRAIPGPGTYNTSKAIGRDANKFSFRPKTLDGGKKPLSHLFP